MLRWELQDKRYRESWGMTKTVRRSGTEASIKAHPRNHMPDFTFIVFMGTQWTDSML